MGTIKFKPPSDPEECTDTEGTVIIPSEEGQYPYGLFATYSQKQGVDEKTRPLITKRDEYLELDVEELAMLIWEHQHYDRAQGFSTSQLDVLHAVQSLAEEQNIILTRHVRGHQYAEDYSQQTVNNALKRLVEYGLVEKVGRGEYEYNGFEEWQPTLEENNTTVD